MSCTSTADCWLAGSGLGFADETAAYHYDLATGSSMTLTPGIAGATSISCRGGSFCVTVGGAAPPESGQSVSPVASWDGNTWTLQFSPALTGGIGLNYVSCASTNACTAIGNQELGSQTLASVRWNGAVWVAGPAPSPLDTLDAISCTSLTSCLTVGQSDSAPPVPAAEQLSPATG